MYKKEINTKEVLELLEKVIQSNCQIQKDFIDFIERLNSQDYYKGIQEGELLGYQKVLNMIEIIRETWDL
mgnify:CR=1 FL=1